MKIPLDPMRELVRRSWLLVLIGYVTLMAGCERANRESKSFRIGFSQCTGDSKWKQATLDALKREMSFHPGSELLYRNAGDDSRLQIQQIKELESAGIDILLVSPNEAKPLTAVVESVFNSGIPVIVIDRKIASNLYTAFVGADNVGIGRMAADYIARSFGDTSHVIELLGLAGSTPTSERLAGFNEGLRAHPKISVKATLHGNWLKEDAKRALFKIRDQLAPTDIVFAQNDPMALGAYEVYKELGLEKKVHIVGVDGLSGPGGGIQLVSDGVLQATLLNPTGGEEALQTAFKVLTNKSYNKESILSTVVIDSSDVRILKLQTDKITSQQSDIESQQSLLAEQKRLYKSQNTIVNILILTLILLLFLASVTYFSLRNNRKNNRKLALQNQTILQQSNELIKMTEKARTATDAKFNFFTSISHEFRTPLTLIMSPLEEALAARSFTTRVKGNLDLALKNTYRLLRLVDQLIDFRKLELNKMRLHASEVNIVEFITGIVASFSDIAEKRDIYLEVVPAAPDIKAWIDSSLFDKVIFNLLSNAFKFTGEHGTIRVNIEHTGGRILIRVTDTGVGMSPEVAERAFELFYEGKEHTAKGSGLGLAFSKQLVELHHGTISVHSEKWKGTRFDVLLPAGCEHLTAEEIAEQDLPALVLPTGPEVPEPIQADTGAGDFKEQSVLLIEDNTELRSYLRGRLQERFEVMEAASGNEGLKVVYETIPDLVVCDIALPGADGFTVAETLKNDVRTSHIPILLMSARNEIDQHIMGFRCKADGFIGKPFNVQHFEAAITSILENRSILRQHFTTEVQPLPQTQSKNRGQRKFIHEVNAIIEKNIANEGFGADNIARELGLSRMQLYRKVKSLIGYNVNEYLLSVRLQRARHLLQDGTLSIAEIAERVGFSSQAYFSTVFKSKFSATPTEFRDSKGGRGRSSGA